MIAIGKWGTAAAFLLLLAPVRAATADEFGDLCVGANVGLEAGDCVCIDGRLTDSGEREQVMALLRAEVEGQRNGTQPDESSPEFQRGMQILDRYINLCVK